MQVTEQNINNCSQASTSESHNQGLSQIFSYCLSQSAFSHSLSLVTEFTPKSEYRKILLQLLKSNDTCIPLHGMIQVFDKCTLTIMPLLTITMYVVYEQMEFTPMMEFKLNQLQRLIKATALSRALVFKIANRIHLLLKWRYLKLTNGLPKQVVDELVSEHYSDEMLDYVIMSYIKVLGDISPKYCDKPVLNWIYKQLMCRVIFYRNHKMIMILQSFKW